MLSRSGFPLAVGLIILLVAARSIALEEDERERYWSGPPQAIGIDLSPTFMQANFSHHIWLVTFSQLTYYRHAVQYNATSGSFTKLASLEGSENYALFMYQLFEHQQQDSRNHAAVYMAFARWNWLRNMGHAITEVTARSSWTSWVNAFMPQVSRNQDFRYRFDTNIDAQPTDPDRPFSWTEWVSLSSRRQNVRDHEDCSPSPNLPLNSTNLVVVLTSALESVKAECLLNHNVNITSVVISKPQTIYNELEELLYRACYEANLEVLDRLDRFEAAMKISEKAEKSAPLVLEQCGYNFHLQRPSSSMSRADLSAAWVPERLTSELLETSFPIAVETMESINEATGRLVVEVARARNIFKYATYDKMDSVDSEEAMVVVPDFGVKGFTLVKALPGSNITRVEGVYLQALQDAIEDIIINRGEAHEYMEKRGLFHDVDQNDDYALRTATYDFVQTVPHPQAAEGRSWCQSVDAILVLADFPDASLIIRAAGRAIGSLWSSECKNVFDPSFKHLNLAARGAALHASVFVSSWEGEQKWKRCAKDDTRPGCWNESGESEEEGDFGISHEEL